jgi:hypothetical protein
MSDVVQHRSGLIDLNTDFGRTFISDACRAGEGLCSDRELQEKYELSDKAFRALAKDKAVGRAIRSESELRIRNGLAAREAAAKHFIKAPGVLDRIMMGAESHPKQKIDAIRELRQVAGGTSGDHQTATEGKFVINITIGSDVERFEFDAPKTAPQVDLEPKDDGNWG